MCEINSIDNYVCIFRVTPFYTMTRVMRKFVIESYYSVG
jgi:hypothetical protein